MSTFFSAEYRATCGCLLRTEEKIQREGAERKKKVAKEERETMNDEKAALLEALRAARVRLWDVMDGFEADAEIYPGWNKRDFFAHISGWEALVYGALRDHAAGVPGTANERFSSTDEENAHFVAVRRSMTLTDVKLECEIYRYAIERMLLDIPAERYGEGVQFPWGSESIVSFLKGAIEHEIFHADDLKGGK
jgi:hypothetical protein